MRNWLDLRRDSERALILVRFGFESSGGGSWLRRNWREFWGARC